LRFGYAVGTGIGRSGRRPADAADRPVLAVGGLPVAAAAVVGKFLAGYAPSGPGEGGKSSVGA
jgi:hypothetical protein